MHTKMSDAKKSLMEIISERAKKKPEIRSEKKKIARNKTYYAISKNGDTLELSEHAKMAQNTVFHV